MENIFYYLYSKNSKWYHLTVLGRGGRCEWVHLSSSAPDSQRLSKRGLSPHGVLVSASADGSLRFKGPQLKKRGAQWNSDPCTIYACLAFFPERERERMDQRDLGCEGERQSARMKKVGVVGLGVKEEVKEKWVRAERATEEHMGALWQDTSPFLKMYFLHKITVKKTH